MTDGYWRDDVNEIIAMAEKLGKAISQSPQAAALKTAQAALQADAEASKLLGEFQAMTQQLAQKESQQQPIEPEEKRKYEEIHTTLIASEAFKAFNAAQVEYVDVIRKANDAIRAQLGPSESA